MTNLHGIFVKLFVNDNNLYKLGKPQKTPKQETNEVTDEHQCKNARSIASKNTGTEEDKLPTFS